MNTKRPRERKSSRDMERRQFLAYFSGAGFATTLLPGTLWSEFAASDKDKITPKMIEAAEKLAGLEFSGPERKQIARGVNGYLRSYERLRQIPLDNDVPPALQFNPILPGMHFEGEQKPIVVSDGPVRDVPEDLEEAAFWPVVDLSRAIKAKKIRCVDLTKMYLDRLKRYDEVLHCVITLTEARALEQAEAADKEISAGKYRGPLHGIPWGAKDLLSAKGYKTTWGAMPFKDQEIDEDATVVRRLDEAGAILVAKLTLGALAQGDVWYGGKTRSPWNPDRGSSGSSAGPAAATAGGLVGFAIGSETNGSIVSPSTRCGVTGLRPTFGRVSRHGAMALSWSMDKLGPLCRTVEDCALVLDAIHGADGKDPTAVENVPFNWDANLDISTLRIGYVKDAFKTEAEDRGRNEESLDTLRSLGVDPVPIELPEISGSMMAFILTVEAATAFDDLTRSGRDEELVSQTGWPVTFRRSRVVPAVEYLRANRVRTLLMRQMAEVMERVDVYITPTMYQLFTGNLTGHPIIALPNGFTEKGEPTSIGFAGNLFGEAKLLAVAKAFQNATEHHLKHPDLSQYV